MTREETRDYSFHNWPVTRAERKIFLTGSFNFQVWKRLRRKRKEQAVV
jgi:hypothetical protein